MNTKILLGTSAVVLGIAGLACSFAPDELVRLLSGSTEKTATLLMQIVGAAFFAFAMANWAARGSLYGGIYNRPLALANLAHFVIGALALVKVVMAGQSNLLLVAATGVYGVFAVGFALAFFRSPVSRAAGEPR